MKLDNFSPDTLRSMLNDLQETVDTLEDDKEYYKTRGQEFLEERNELRRDLECEQTRTDEAVVKLDAALDHGQAQSRAQSRREMAQQFCDGASGLDSHAALAVLGLVSEYGFKIPAIKAYRAKNGAGLKESKETIDNWRNILGHFANNPEPRC